MFKLERCWTWCEDRSCWCVILEFRSLIAWKRLLRLRSRIWGFDVLSGGVVLNQDEVKSRPLASGAGVCVVCKGPVLPLMVVRPMTLFDGVFVIST